MRNNVLKLSIAVAVLGLTAVAAGPKLARAGASTNWPVTFSQDSGGYTWVTGTIADTRITSNSIDEMTCWYVASSGWLECRAYQFVTQGAAKRVSCGTSRAWSSTFAGINASSKVTFRCGPGGVLDYFEVANSSVFLN